MKNIAEIKSTLEKDKALEGILNLLIEYSLSNQTLIFNKDATRIEFEKLTKYQVIKLQSDNYHIADFEVFAFNLYSRYTNKSKITLSDDFNTFILLLKEIEADYKSEKFVQNLTALFNQLWAIAILDANQKFGINFSDYIKSADIEVNRDDLFSFNEGFSRALPLLNLEVQEFFQNIIRLINLTKSDADYNMPRGSLLRGVRNKIKVDEKWGLQCYTHSIKQSDVEIDFLIPVITGLYDIIGISFYQDHLKAKNTMETYNVSIICGLSNVEYVREEECDLFFQIYNQADKNNPHVLINLPRLLFAILKSKEESINSKHIQKTFELLTELLGFDNENLICYILRECEFQNDHLVLIQELIINFIKQPHFKQEYLILINHFLWHIKNLPYFEKVLYTLGEILPFKSVAKNLSSTINEFRSTQKREFDKVVVNLLIQDKASYRFLATEIFNDLFSENYTFDFDILELNSLNQYKLWVSMFQNYREPKYILSCLLPLLKSKSSIVAEAFICKLEEYTESYGASVTNILKQKLDLEDKDLKAIYERVEDYRLSFFKNNVLVKEGIKELNPAYSQNRIFVDFNKNHNRRFSRQIQKSSDKNSFFLNFCTKVTLLKGGGWKIDGRDEISKLGKIGSSFSLPRTYFTSPEKFDFESSMEMANNWNENSFAEIKRFIENEQQ